MADKIEVNIGTLSSDIQDLNSWAQKAREDLAGLEEAIESLNASWEGSAHDAFMAQYSQDQATMTEALNTLDKFLDSAINARDEYAKCEQSVEELVNAIQV
ncbi:MAG: WXG100 family type VII secretion target [Lachnospiraceae bacterium]|nr:WXG100 family type VII secretion target [Lachnospiraceae bacterium]